jgi:hypothetical protein
MWRLGFVLPYIN